MKLLFLTTILIISHAKLSEAHVFLWNVFSKKKQFSCFTWLLVFLVRDQIVDLPFFKLRKSLKNSTTFPIAVLSFESIEDREPAYFCWRLNGDSFISGTEFRGFCTISPQFSGQIAQVGVHF